MKTVAPHYKTTCCMFNEPLYTWYEKLKARCGKTNESDREVARQAYKTAIKPLKKLADAEKWLDQWEVAILKAQNRNVGDAADVTAWATDFLSAIQDLQPMWATSYKLSNRDKINKGTLTVQELSNDFREHIRTNPPPKFKGSRGAFGTTTFNGEEDDDNKDKQQPRGAAQGGRGRRRGGKTRNKRLREEEEQEVQEDSPGCQACGMRMHSIDRCFYVHPHLAWAGWKPNQEVKDLVDQKLANNLSLQELVRITKRSRTKSRTPAPKGETSQTPEIQD
jgi:hypothetical protein